MSAFRLTDRLFWTRTYGDKTHGPSASDRANTIVRVVAENRLFETWVVASESLSAVRQCAAVTHKAF